MVALFLILTSGCVCVSFWCILRPKMTVSITFDDGLKSHLIAARELERYGWRGAFNVITDFASSDDPKLSQWQLIDLCVDDRKGRFMNWNDISELVKHGHEVYPHTCDHSDLVELSQKCNGHELCRQVEDSINACLQHLGVRPKFFCLPHNTINQEVALVLRQNKIVPFARNRVNFGSDTPRTSMLSISNYIKECRLAGRRHLDLMIHGILGVGDGWRSFSGVDDFREFCADLHMAEQNGLIEVVPYAKAHYSFEHPVASLVDRFVTKGKRVVYRIVFRQPILKRP